MSSLPAQPIVDERVLPPGAPRTRGYLLRSALALAAIALFAVRWITLPGRGEHPLLFLLASLLAAYYVGVWAARWVALQRMRRPLPLAPEPGRRVAVVTSFVPGAEPLAMLEGTLPALLALEYPHDTWVLDEGDATEVRALCQRLGARHFTRRQDPRYQQPAGPFAAGTKHGNYNAWLTEAGYGAYDTMATFDPDFVPRPEYLTRLLGYFRDPGVAYVQAPPVYYNDRASFIARGAAEETYAYHSSHQMASYALGHPVITGSHTTHRVAALREVGGFPAHDAEDLYLTMRYRSGRWRGVYVPRILALGTTPVDWPGYLRQQMRWARAVLDLKLRVLPGLGLPLRDRLLSLFHGAYYLRPLTLLLVLVMLLAMLLDGAVPRFLTGREFLVAVALLAVLPVADRFRELFYFDRQRERGLHWRALLLQLAKWPHLVAALADAVLNRKVGYVITRKTASSKKEWVLTPPHLGIALLIALVAGIGAARHGGLPALLWVLAGLGIAVSLLLVWTETWQYPAPYQPALLEQRLSELRDVLEPAESSGEGNPGVVTTDLS